MIKENYLLTLFITYVVRLIIPFLKKIHDFTNDLALRHEIKPND